MPFLTSRSSIFCKVSYVFDASTKSCTFETYSSSANLKAMPRQLKRTETREQASEKGRNRRSLELQSSTQLARTSNASAMAASGVTVASLQLSSSSMASILFVSLHILRIHLFTSQISTEGTEKGRVSQNRLWNDDFMCFFFFFFVRNFENDRLWIHGLAKNAVCPKQRDFVYTRAGASEP